MNFAAVSKLAAGLVCLSHIGIVQAAKKAMPSESQAIDIRVQREGFGRASAADIAAVLESAAGELWQYCPNTQLPGIDVYRRADHPQINFETVSGGRLAIGLATQDTHWAQYSFQFA